MNIGNRISEFRRKKGATQEQIANFVGVSVAAVSKWETENSYPDITLLPAIAGYLGVSIDALMDFDLTDKSIEALRDLDNKYVKNSDYNTGIPLYEEAVKKMPNDCNLNQNYAHLLLAKAFSKPVPDIKIAKKAIFHFEKALQSIDDIDTKNSLLQNLAFVYGGIGEYDKAIAYLEKTGERTHEWQIADYMMKMNKYAEAKVKLQQVLYNTAFEFGCLTCALIKCFEREGDKASVRKLTELNAVFREYFANSQTPNYFDALSSTDFSRLAAEYQKEQKTDEMWKALSTAAAHAIRFDADPSYDVSDVCFMNGFQGSFANSSSANACLPLIRYIESTFSDFRNDPRYISLIEKLNQAKSDKKTSGIWK